MISSTMVRFLPEVSLARQRSLFTCFFIDLYKIFSEDTKGLENFVESLVSQVQVNTQNMTFPDFLILMSQRKGVSSPLHPVRDLFKVSNNYISPLYPLLEL